MCRYAMCGPYKSHFACFDCRKAFKQPAIEEWLAVRGRDFAYRELVDLWSHRAALARREAELGIRLVDLQVEYRDSAHCCPVCGEPMVDMGLDFKPPRQSDVKAWRILQGMFRIGHVFHTCGCDGPGYIPKSSSQYRAYLEERRRSFVDEMIRVQNANGLPADAKREARNYWSDRIGRIDQVLAAIS